RRGPPPPPSSPRPPTPSGVPPARPPPGRAPPRLDPPARRRRVDAVRLGHPALRHGGRGSFRRLLRRPWVAGGDLDRLRPRPRGRRMEGPAGPLWLRPSSHSIRDGCVSYPSALVPGGATLLVSEGRSMGDKMHHRPRWALRA